MKLPIQQATHPLVLLQTCQPACVNMCQSNCAIGQLEPPPPPQQNDELSPFGGCAPACRPACTSECAQRAAAEPLALSSSSLVMAQAGNFRTASSFDDPNAAAVSSKILIKKRAHRTLKIKKCRRTAAARKSAAYALPKHRASERVARLTFERRPA